MLMLKKINIAFLLLLLSVQMFAQQQVKSSVAGADFMRINEAYSNSKKLKMNIGYVLYASYTSTIPSENAKGVFMKQNNSTYSELLGFTSLNNNKVSLSVDQNEQTIIVTDPPSKTVIPGAVDFDTLLKICSSITYKELDGNIKLYKLRFDNVVSSQYNAIDIYFNGETFLLTRLSLYFREEADLNENDNIHVKEKPRLEISYTSIETSPVFEPGQFSEARYINVTGKKITCASAYKAFHLINHKLS